MKKVWQKLFLISFPLTTFGSLAPITSIKAQITPDNSLGAESSVVNPNLTIKGISSDRIDGGARRGNNLFHSFQEFNVAAQRGAYFSNPTGVDNILTRVTGSNASNISGRLGVLGNANLFLINPNGIVFGQNASLDVRGSFFASTASSLIFNNGFEFSALNPQAPPLLTVNIPIGLRFRDNPGSISNQSMVVDTENNPVGLQVPSGNTLALLGGDVSLDGGRLTASGGRVELGGLAREGTLGLNVDGNTMSLSFPDGVARGSVSLKNSSNVDVSGGGSGSIAINARNLDLQQSKLIADVRSSSDTPSLRVGDITVNATEAIKLGQSSRIESTVSTGTNNGSNINITTGSLSITDTGEVNTFTSGQGNAGNVNINARDNVSFDGASNGLASGIVSIAQQQSTGNAGNININTGTFSLTNGGGVFAISNGQGLTGSVTINARDGISLDGAGSSVYNLLNNGMGNSGGIRITAGTLSLANGAQLNTSTSGIGNAGDISINTGTLTLRNGAQLNTSTSGMGYAGNVNVNARDYVSFDGNSNNNASGIISIANSTGNAGNININTGTFSLTNGGGVFAISDGQGATGSVTINARDGISLDGAKSGVNNFLKNGMGNSGGIHITAGTLSLANGAQLNTSTSGIGNAGDISINTGTLTLRNGAQLNTSTSGIGNAGNVNVNARDYIEFDGNRNNDASGIISIVNSTGNAGNININTGTLSLTNGAVVDAIVDAMHNGQGSAGSVTIHARDRVSLDGMHSGVNTFNNSINSIGNNGGISITTGTLSITNGAELNTSTFGMGNAGDVTIDARDRVSFNNGRVFTNANSTATGLGGDISITSRDISLDNGSLIIPSTAGQGNAGNTSINTDTLALTNGSGVFASSNGQGSAGSVTINARDSVSLDGANGIYTSSSTNSIGNNGDIRIKAGSLTLRNGAQLNTSTSGMGNAGNVTIDAPNGVSFNNGRIIASANNTATGLGGDVSITSGDISLANRSLIVLSTTGQGNAGNASLTARSLSFSDGSELTLSTEGQGKAGNAFFTTRSLSLTDGSRLTASSRGNSGAIGNGGNIDLQIGDLLLLRRESLISTSADSNAFAANSGNITINAPLIVAFPSNNDITANASRGSGGQVTIKTQALFGIAPLSRAELQRRLNTIEPNQLNPNNLPTSDITAISQQSPTLNGTVDINFSYLDTSQSLVKLPENVVDSTRQIAQNPCQQGVGSSFAITGRGGIASNPNQTLASENVRVGLVTPASGRRTATINSALPSTNPTVKKAVPVQGWVFNDKGQVVLTAYDPTLTASQRPWQTPASCAKR